MVKIETTNSMRFDIFIAGDLDQCKQVCREHCMAKLQRELNTNFWQEPDGSGLFLDQLDPNRGVQHDEPVIECGVVCDSTELEAEEAPRLFLAEVDDSFQQSQELMARVGIELAALGREKTIEADLIAFQERLRRRVLA